MYSFSIDYLFNRVYDCLLWIKYTWLFTILRNDKGVYLEEVSYRDWDGLRDRGWFDEYLAIQNGEIIPKENVSFFQGILEKLGLKVRDTDSDGIPDVSDPHPYDSENLSKAELKERYEEDYTFNDHIRDIFGVGPKDSDRDAVPDSFERAHGMDYENPDSDRDGVLDGQELLQGTDPLNSDTDNDLVLDGRDEAPLDPNISSIGQDTDGDGVSDKIEGVLGSDTNLKDSDGDGITDNMDTYVLDPENIGRIQLPDLSPAAQGVHFAIQNPVLSLFSDIISVLVIVMMLVLVYAATRWFIEFLSNLNHFEHHFHHDDHHPHSVHVIHDASHEMPAGIANLPITPAPTPTFKEFEAHPKFAIIQGYMSSPSEALWRIGILEADNVLLETLKEKGYQGESVSDLLKNASFKTVDLAWDAHKIRNRIAHEGSNFELTEREARRAFSLYESVFRDLKII